MSIDQIIPMALDLPVKDRALLAASLWESIADPFEIAEDFDDKKAIETALQRDAEIESGKVAPLSHEELMNRLRRR